MKKGNRKMADFEVKLGQLLTSLSYALDIAENRYYGHSRRTAYISYNLAREMGLDPKDIMNAYYAALIHDIGMAGHMAKYTIMDIHYKEDLLKEHCKFGYEILKGLPINTGIDKYVLYHHENWDGSGPYGLRRDEIPLIAQIIHLADYFELFFTREANFSAPSHIGDSYIKWLSEYKNKRFNPLICDAFLDLARKEKFWWDMQSENLDTVVGLIDPAKDIGLNIGELHQISKTFSLLIDAKSNYTYEHSKGVSKYVNMFAKHLGYDEFMVDKLTIAADLHDIGKFVVPSAILDKPGNLNQEEFIVMKSHVYYTKLILKQIDGLEDIAEWAGNHHEKLNGEGYPERLDGNTLTQEDQIVAFADIYQALTEDRPYRPGMTAKKSTAILEKMVGRGHLCGNLFREFKQMVL